MDIRIKAGPKSAISPIIIFKAIIPLRVFAHRLDR